MFVSCCNTWSNDAADGRFQIHRSHGLTHCELSTFAVFQMSALQMSLIIRRAAAAIILMNCLLSM